jgi:hypothetical protein
MLNKVTKLLIGKDIARTAGVTSATTFPALILVSTGLKDGEVVVLDKNKVPLAPGSTFADSDSIFICQGTSIQYSYTQPGGSVITARKLVISDEIQGAMVRKYTGTQYQAKVEQVTTHTITGTVTAGTEYIVRIIYKDMPEHPGQFTQTYRVIANATATSTALNTQMAAKINSHKGRRVTATDNTSAVLTLTGLAIPDSTTGLTDIDGFSMVEFVSTYNYVNSTGVQTTLANTIAIQAAEYGSGNWVQIRDMEASLEGYRGVMNKINFPYNLLAPVVDTVSGGYYDLIIIEHDAEYLSPDNQYRKQAPKQTNIALATASTGTNANDQSATVVGTLNSWMASLPKSFGPITI